MTSSVAPDPILRAGTLGDSAEEHAQRLIAQLRGRIEHLERVTLLGAKEVEALADEVERLTVENEQLRRPRGVRASFSRAWHRLDS